jgi:hypothetical protein
MYQMQTQMNFGFGPQRGGNGNDLVDQYGGAEIMNKTTTQDLTKIAKRSLIMNKTMSVMSKRKRGSSSTAIKNGVQKVVDACESNGTEADDDKLQPVNMNA